MLENTIIVYTADHGELAGEHGVWWKNSWHEAAMRVPFFVQLPAHRRGELPAARLETPTSLADLFPTLCGLAGVAGPADLEGVDLSDAILTGQEPVRGPVFADNPLPRWGEGAEHRIVREGDYKYVAFRSMAPDLLFDLAADPLEQINLVENGDAHHREIATQLRALVDASWDFDAAQAQYEADRDETEANPLQLDGEWSSNLYLMPDNRLVAADTPLYAPLTLTDRPQDVFADWPED